MQQSAGSDARERKCVAEFDSGSAAGGQSSMTNSAAGRMRDDARPLALGYARKHLLMVESEVSRTKEERLAYFAETAGYRLGEIFIEEVQTWPSAFEALIEAARIEKPSAVILPSLLHFAVLGSPATIKGHFEHLTGAKVVTSIGIVSYSPGEPVS